MAKQKPISSLEDHLGYWLRFVSNHVSQAFADKVHRHDITVAEWVVLRELFDGLKTSSWLADRLGMTRGGMSKLADRLESKKLILRNMSENDRRFYDLALTPAGRTLVPALAAAADQNDREFFDHLSVEDQRTLVRLMKEIVEKGRMGTIPIV